MFKIPGSEHGTSGTVEVEVRHRWVTGRRFW